MDIFRLYFVKQRCKQEEKDAVNLFMTLGKDSDALVQTIWRQCLDGMNREIPVPLAPQKARDTNSVIERPVSMTEHAGKKLFQSTGVFRTGAALSLKTDAPKVRPTRLHTGQRKAGITVLRTAQKRKGLDPFQTGKSRLNYL